MSTFETAAAVGINVAKVWLPTCGYLAFVSIAEVKEVVSLFGAVITIICTVWVAHSTVRKNARKAAHPVVPALASEREPKTDL